MLQSVDLMVPGRLGVPIDMAARAQLGIIIEGARRDHHVTTALYQPG